MPVYLTAMAFSDYKTIAQVQTEYKIKYEEYNFIPVKEYKASDTFIEEF
ncbi:MAG: hypothetical protein F6J86_42595 [Symploca sp. SIO1B1]|nr:hypothetical protein [Symploca sp. SIO1B1]